MNNLTKIAAIGLTLTLSSTAWADFIVDDGPLDGTDVGGVDIDLGQIVKADLEALCGTGGSESVEECWVESILGTDVTFGTKEETVPWYDTNNGNVAFELFGGPGWYVVKNANSRVLLENVASLDWGVLSGTLKGFLNLGDDMIISHFTPFGGDNGHDVPEPGSLALLGVGLLSLGVMRRKRRQI